MARSFEKVDASDIPRDSIFSDTLSIYIGKPASLSVRSRANDSSFGPATKSNVLKRKRSKLRNGVPPVELRKRSGKEVPLNSFLPGNSRIRNRLGMSRLKANAYISGVGKRDKPTSSSCGPKNLGYLRDSVSDTGKSLTSSSGKEENQFFSGCDLQSKDCLGGRIIISKRPRGNLRRKKSDRSFNLDREAACGSSNTKSSSTDQLRIKLSAPKSHVRKQKRKLTEYMGVGCSDTGDPICKRVDTKDDNVKSTVKKFRGRKGPGSFLLHNEASTLKPLGDAPDDDEDNLEQNAARMLSSRFDPSFTDSSNSSVTRSANESSLGPSQRNFSSSVSLSTTSRVLRPRKQNGRGFVRKRRHFYEVCSNNVDPYWVIKQRIRVFWPLDKCWYFGLVKDYDPVTKMHHVKYDDRDEEWINLQNERFKLLLFPSEVANKFDHETSINETKDTDKEKQKGLINDHSNVGLMETEPIISWLTRSTRKERSSTFTIMNKQRVLSEIGGSKPSGIKSMVSNLSSSLIERPTEEDNPDNKIGFDNGQLPFVYFRRRVRKDRGYMTNTMDKKSSHAGSCGLISLLASIAGKGSALEWFYITITPALLANVTLRLRLPISGRCKTTFGFDNLWLSSTVFFLHHCKLMQLFPFVRMEILFVDSVRDVKLFLFDGCLSWIAAILCQTLGGFVFHKKSNISSAKNILPKLVKFKLSNLNCYVGTLRYIFNSFVEMQNSNWTSLENILKQHCTNFKQFSGAGCACGYIQSLGRRCDTHFQDFKETILVEGCNEDNNNPVSVDGSGKISDVIHKNTCSSCLANVHSNPSTSANLRVEIDALSVSSDGDWNMPSHDCLSSKVNEVAHSMLPDHARYYRGSKKMCSSSNDSSSPEKFDGAHISSMKRTGIQVQELSAAEQTTLRGNQGGHSTMLLQMNDRAIYSSPSTAQQSVWHMPSDSSVSPILGPRSNLWSEDFIQSGFLSTTKKPRTQVSYPSLSRGREITFRNTDHHRKGGLNKKVRSNVSKKAIVGFAGHRSSQESLTCYANVLVTAGDRGWRECGAEVVLDSDNQKDWLIVAKVSGITKFSYKAHQMLQPGVPNRYTHAMMWKGGKNWTLEFTDRNQWLLFKMMHERCFNENIKAASVKNIPIPGVRLIDDDAEVISEVPYVCNLPKYYQQVGTEVEMALDPSHVLYDMDSDDEHWLSEFRKSLDNNGSQTYDVTDDMFERVMDTFEKVAYVKQCDSLNDDEIEEVMEGVGSLDIIKSIHERWCRKRQNKGMPLIRQFQPPLWEYYLQRLKDWELAMIKLQNTADESQDKKNVPENVPEKPSMFAFCLRPRGLESLNKGSKQRSHRKLMYTSSHSSFSREQEGIHASGRRLNVSSVGEDKALVAFPNFESSHPSQWLQTFSSFSPKDIARAANVAMAADSRDRIRSPKFLRNLSKKNGMHHSTWDNLVMQSSCSEKPRIIDRQNIDKWEWTSSKQLQLDCLQRQQQTDINEFRMRDASSAAQHASNMAKLKREKGSVVDAQSRSCTSQGCGCNNDS
ncbi:hypothetical protein HPP92_009653 [Vanilla planifolia]|uniref:Enhancer of polycomb-like protein n=1 Tax=Vanilla planifolia TaxID=51239 RepID=A0A835RBY2_VANPL|nr:hypothetical protein HPP92_009653 [Vanilla planifolia]